MADQATFSEDAMPLMDGLYSAAMRMTRNAADAEDLVQETYLKAFNAYERLRWARTSRRGCIASSPTATSTPIARSSAGPTNPTSTTSRISTSTDALVVLSRRC